MAIALVNVGQHLHDHFARRLDLVTLIWELSHVYPMLCQFYLSRIGNLWSTQSRIRAKWSPCTNLDRQFLSFLWVHYYLELEDVADLGDGDHGDRAEERHYAQHGRRHTTQVDALKARQIITALVIRAESESGIGNRGNQTRVFFE